MKYNPEMYRWPKLDWVKRSRSVYCPTLRRNVQAIEDKACLLFVDYLNDGKPNHRIVQIETLDYGPDSILYSSDPYKTSQEMFWRFVDSLSDSAFVAWCRDIYESRCGYI